MEAFPLNERIEYLRQRNSTRAAASQRVIQWPEETEGFKLRSAALLRKFAPEIAPPCATTSANETPSSAAADNVLSRALSVITTSTGAPSSRVRPREEPVSHNTVSNAVVTVDPTLLRDRALREEQQPGVATSVPLQQPPWKLSKVLVGHRGWVRCAAVDHSNEWFCTGANDSVIKVWDLATGNCKVNLIGHKESVRGIALSEQTPYLYSCGDDHALKGWDLERNEVVRDFHGHSSAVYSVATHPALDHVIVSGSRDRTVRVWDVRSRASVSVFKGHNGGVLTVAAQAVDPQVISGGDDGMIYLWDLCAGSAMTRLTRHNKPVRAVVPHHAEQSLLSCGADNIRKWKLPEGDFVTNMNLKSVAKPPSIATCVWVCAAISKRNTVAVGSEDGQLMLIDWESHSLFQAAKSKPIRGSLEAERGILCCAFDASGTRLITGEGDKTVRIWNRQEE